MIGDLSSFGFSDLSHIWCHTKAYSPFQSRFVDPRLIGMIALNFEVHIGWMIRFHYALVLRRAFLESFDRICISWYSRDSWTELPQAREFPHHHFSKVHARSFVRSHGVILELSGQIGCIWCHTGACFPNLAMEMIIPSQVCYSFHYSVERYCICLTNRYSCDFRRDELSVEHDVRVWIAPLARTIQWIVMSRSWCVSYQTTPRDYRIIHLGWQ